MLTFFLLFSYKNSEKKRKIAYKVWCYLFHLFVDYVKLQLTKILLVPQKCEIILGAVSKRSIFKIAMSILDFYLLLPIKWSLFQFYDKTISLRSLSLCLIFIFLVHCILVNYFFSLWKNEKIFAIAITNFTIAIVGTGRIITIVKKQRTDTKN